MSSTDSRWSRLEELFHAASELEGVARTLYVLRECGGDRSLRRELEAMLAAEPEAEFLVAPEPVEVAAEPPRAGAEIGGYRVLRPIARGGMGTVYEALQLQPERRVALKVLGGGLCTSSAVRRFEYEAEVLGRLRHEGIAQVFAAGTCEESGRTVPWFAMELIEDALPITDFAESYELSVRDRIELFTAVCDAVHHGHGKGVIHRDIKPDNVLVDGMGQPKVIDFGVARHVDTEAQLTTMHTAAGEIVGTLGYMSPEQCGGDVTDIDTRSDVYALGVLLYELLSGELPYDYGSAALPEAVRVIRESAPKRLTGVVAADVEAIVFKALEKNPQRRYPSVAAFADDLRRFLHDEPVRARPPSLTYHLRLFARRHRALMMSAATVAVVLVGATVVSAVFAMESSARAVEAERARDDMDVERRAATEMLAFLTELLRSGNPSITRQDTSVRDLLLAAVPQVEARFAEQPRIRARMLNTIADGLRGLGRNKAARREATKALAILEGLDGDTRYDRALSLSVIGVAAMLLQDFAASESALRRALALRRDLHGEAHAGYATVLSRLGSLKTLSHKPAEAEPLLRRALAIRRALPEIEQGDGSEIAQNLASLGAAFYHKYELDKAAELMQQALREFERGGWAQNVLYAKTLSNLGQVRQVQRQFAASEQHFTEALRIFRAHEKDSEDVANTHEKLGFLFNAQGATDRAEAALREALAIRRRVHGADSAMVGRTLVSIGYVHITAERFTSALEPLREAHTIQKAKLGAKSIALSGTLVLLGRALLRTDAPKAALPLLAEAVQIRTNLGAKHVKLAMARSAWAECRSVLGEHAAAEPVLLATHARIEQSVGPKHMETRAARRRLVEHFARCGRPDEAAKWR